MNYPNDMFVRTIDYAVLKPTATEADVRREARYAATMNFASLCTYPQYVKAAAEELEGSSTIPSAVIGFPLGNFPAFVKIKEAEFALEQGARELDVVINQASFATEDYGYVKSEIWELAQITHNNDALLKVIIETCYLNTAKMKLACLLAEQGGADYVKTSTGFGTKGADLFLTNVIVLVVDGKMGVKASGGIKTRERAEEFIKMGCSRLGIGSAIKDIMK
jgi:deoxyribose-phosphate aldolase